MESLLAIHARFTGVLTHNLLTSGSINGYNLHPSSGSSLRSDILLIQRHLRGNTSTYWASRCPGQIYPSALGAIEPTSTCHEGVAISDSSRANPQTTAGVVVTATCEGATEILAVPPFPFKVATVLNASILPCSLSAKSYHQMGQLPDYLSQ